MYCMKLVGDSIGMAAHQEIWESVRDIYRVTARGDAATLKQGTNQKQVGYKESRSTRPFGGHGDGKSELLQKYIYVEQLDTGGEQVVA